MDSAFCKEHWIHLSGPRLGRPGKDHSKELLQELKEIGECNEVEGKFGNGKRKPGLSRIMAKLAENIGARIRMGIFILNMEKLMRQEASLRTHFWKLFFFFVLSIRKQHKNDVISVAWVAVGGIVADQYTLNILEVEANTNSHCVAEKCCKAI